MQVSRRLPITALTIGMGIDPNIAHFGGMMLTWPWVFVATAIAAGVLVAAKIARRFGFSEDDINAVALVGIAAGNGEHISRASNLPWAVERTNPNSMSFGHGPSHRVVAYEFLGDLGYLRAAVPAARSLPACRG